MKNSARKSAEVGSFFDPRCDNASKLARSARPRPVTNDRFVDALHEGKPAKLYVPPKEPLEKEIETRIRVLLAAHGVLVLKHTIESCHACGTRPSPRTGLGSGTADLFCIVPPLGRVLFIEVKRKKTKNAKRDEHQRQRALVVRRYGGVAGTATCEAEALALLAEARKR